MEKRYEDAIIALCEMILDYSKDAKYKEYLLKGLQTKLDELERQAGKKKS